MTHKFNYNWKLADGYPAKNGLKVFSCFACGGGSTMGYKLAGFEVIGFNEIDPKMAECYIANHNPKYAYIEPIQQFKLREDLPEELYNLDILDGSPPCSSFSMAGNREEDWGKEKKFREGQAEQVLDTLFFDFIDLGAKLQPKVIIAENVKGLLLGDAKKYVRRINDAFNSAGYMVQHWLLDASKMGVPQRRERVFFIALRKDLCQPFLKHMDLFTIKPALRLEFNEPEIPFSAIKQNEQGFKPVSDFIQHLWSHRNINDTDLSTVSGRVNNKPNNFFNWGLIKQDRVLYTITGDNKNILYDECRYMSDREMMLAGSYPLDYDFKTNKPSYLIGMSVPPVMTAQIASQVYTQWLSKLQINVQARAA